MADEKKRTPKKRGAGEGSIFQRSDGKWTATITVGYSTDGKRVRRVVYGDTKKQVTDKLTRLQGQKLDGTLTTTDAQKLGEYLTTWLDNEPRLAPTTRLRYRSVIEKHISPRIGGLKVSAVRVAHIEAFMAGLRADGASEDTALYAYSVLHRGFSRLVKQRRIVVHPCEALDRPKVERIARPSLDTEQAEALMAAAAGHRLEAVFVLAITTGLRQGELFGLQWEDVDLDNGTLTVRHSLEEIRGKLRLKPPKTKAGLRTVRLSQNAVEALRERWALAMAEDAAGVAFVFCDSNGGPLRKSNFQRRVWEPIRKAADLPDTFRFHDLRHTSASLLLKAGVNPKVVQQRLGHSDIRTTLGTYSHVMQGLDEAAAATFDTLKRGKPADGYTVATNPGSGAAECDNATAETVASQGVQ